MRELVPEANVAVGHGQMRERDLEQLDARFLSPALQRAGLHDHHRKRHRRAHREHHHHRPRRSIRPGADPPAARPRRPLAPPRLRLSDHAAAQGDDRRCGQAPRSARIAGGARRRIHAGHPRSRDSRRRRAAGRRTERPDPGDRLQPLHGIAGARRRRPEVRQAGGPRKAARCGARGRAAPAGAHSRGLRPRRALAPGALQAHRRQPNRARSSTN